MNKYFDKTEYLIEDFSANNFCVDTERKKQEKRFSKKLEVTDKFNRQNVSFQSNKRERIHNWLKYREGFSFDLVESLIDEMDISNNEWIMDPFFGSGTTGVVCCRKGINCIGLDILPTSKIAVDVKKNIYKYNIAELEKLLYDIKKMSLPKKYNKFTNYLTITQYAYPEYNDKFLSYIHEWINDNQYSYLVNQLLTLAIINCLEECSYTIKSGQYLSWDYRSKKVKNENKKRGKDGKKLLPNKIVRKEIGDIKSSIIFELEKMVSDIKQIQESNDIFYKGKIKFKNSSVLTVLPFLQSNSINGVITSPPYCNRYDYTRTYALELAFLGVDDVQLKKLRQSLLTCTVENKEKDDVLFNIYEKKHDISFYYRIKKILNDDRVLQEIIYALEKRNRNGEVNNKGIIRMVKGYFTELAFVYAEIFRVCKNNSYVIFVNDNVRYAGEVIPVDFISCSIAEKLGYKVEKIYCIRQQKGNSSQQMSKYGRQPLRKSITIWKKVFDRNFR